jgi:hypothetical protein
VFRGTKEKGGASFVIYLLVFISFWLSIYRERLAMCPYCVLPLEFLETQIFLLGGFLPAHRSTVFVHSQSYVSLHNGASLLGCFGMHTFDKI